MSNNLYDAPKHGPTHTLTNTQVDIDRFILYAAKETYIEIGWRPRHIPKRSHAPFMYRNISKYMLCVCVYVCSVCVCVVDIYLPDAFPECHKRFARFACFAHFSSLAFASCCLFYFMRYPVSKLTMRKGCVYYAYCRVSCSRSCLFFYYQ